MYIDRLTDRVHFPGTVITGQRVYNWTKDFDINTNLSVFYITLTFTAIPWNCGGTVTVQSTTQNQYMQNKTMKYMVSGAYNVYGDCFVQFVGSSGGVYDLVALQKHSIVSNTMTLKFVSQNDVITNSTAFFDLIVRGADMSVSYSYS